MTQEPWDNQDHEVSFGHMMISMLLKMVLGFLVICIMMVPHLNDISKAKSQDAAVDPPGNVIVEARWPDALNADVDLWVKAPGDVPVGYSNKGGLIFNLLRDDLGTQADPLKINMETSYSRGIPPGEYIVNLHLYRNPSNTYPVPVTVAVRCSPGLKDGPPSKNIIDTEVDLVREGQEYTALRFKLDEACNLVPGSVNNVFRPLRSGGK